jgi:hypothetical protein
MFLLRNMVIATDLSRKRNAFPIDVWSGKKWLTVYPSTLRTVRR